MESSQHYDKILSGTLCKWLQPIRTSKLGSGRSVETFCFGRRQAVRCACACGNPYSQPHECTRPVNVGQLQGRTRPFHYLRKRGAAAVGSATPSLLSRTNYHTGVRLGRARALEAC